MKENIRTIGIDDSAFDRLKSTKTFVFGIIVRGNSLVEGVLRTEIQIDGLKATEKIVSMITNSKYHKQLKAIFLRSSTIAAFNIIDMNLLYEKTSIPVITILTERPDEDNVENAISNLDDWKDRLNILNKNPPIKEISFYNKERRECVVLVQQVGLNMSEIKKLLKISCYSSCIPESLRLADKIGQSFKGFILD